MSKIIIESHEPNLVASIQLPASKSISNRAFILQQVVQQKTGKHIPILNPSEADDTQIIRKALDQTSGIIDIKNAGTCLRFLTAYYAATPGCEISITGSERMKQRPIAPLVTALTQIGAKITYLEENNALPILIKGTQLKGGKLNVAANESSQFVSALMLIAPLMQEPLSIELEENSVSKDYIVMTQQLLIQFGVECKITNNFTLVQTENNTNLNTIDSYTIEADWSSAAFFYQAALLADKADILFPGLFLKSIQGDAIIATWLNEMGIRTLEKEEGVYITKGKSPNKSNFEFDFSNNPDLAPALVCASAGAAFDFKANGLASLAHKESNRLIALQNTLQQLHFKVETDQKSYLKHDGLQHAFYTNNTLNTESDHRLAMAYAMLAIQFSSIHLSEIDSVEKSFPNFIQEAEKIGLKMRVV